MENKLTKTILLGISAIVGAVVAGTVYKTATKTQDETLLIGDVETEADDSQQ